MTVLEIGIWQLACLLSPRISNSERRKEYLSTLNVLLTYRMLSSRPEPKPTEENVQRYLLPSLSLSYSLLHIIPRSSKMNVLPREGLVVIGRSDISLSLENCLAESIKLTWLLSSCTIQMYISEAES